MKQWGEDPSPPSHPPPSPLSPSLPLLTLPPLPPPSNPPPSLCLSTRLITAIRRAETSRNWGGLTEQTVPRDGTLFLGTCSRAQPFCLVDLWQELRATGLNLISFLFIVRHDGTSWFSLTVHGVSFYLRRGLNGVQLLTLDYPEEHEPWSRLCWVCVWSACSVCLCVLRPCVSVWLSEPELAVEGTIYPRYLT